MSDSDPLRLQEVDVTAEMEVWKPFCQGDVRREQLLEQNLRIQNRLAELMATATPTEGQALARVADTLLKALEQQARFLGVDLKRSREALHLDTPEQVNEWWRGIMRIYREAIANLTPADHNRLQALMSDMMKSA